MTIDIEKLIQDIDEEAEEAVNDLLTPQRGWVRKFERGMSNFFPPLIRVDCRRRRDHGPGRVRKRTPRRKGGKRR